VRGWCGGVDGGSSRVGLRARALLSLPPANERGDLCWQVRTQPLSAMVPCVLLFASLLLHPIVAWRKAEKFVEGKYKAQLKAVPVSVQHLLCLMEVWFDWSQPLLEDLSRFTYVALESETVGCPFCGARYEEEYAN
jgi:hypothetical protein